MSRMSEKATCKGIPDPIESNPRWTSTENVPACFVYLKRSHVFSIFKVLEHIEEGRFSSCKASKRVTVRKSSTLMSLGPNSTRILGIF